MEERYIELINSFKKLDINDKRSEIHKNMLELLNLLYNVNKNINDMNDVLPIFSNYEDEKQFLDSLFSCIISIKEENAKLIDNINKMQ